MRCCILVFGCDKFLVQFLILTKSIMKEIMCNVLRAGEQETTCALTSSGVFICGDV